MVTKKGIKHYSSASKWDRWSTWEDEEDITPVPFNSTNAAGRSDDNDFHRIIVCCSVPDTPNKNMTHELVGKSVSQEMTPPSSSVQFTTVSRLKQTTFFLWFRPAVGEQFAQSPSTWLRSRSTGKHESSIWWKFVSEVKLSPIPAPIYALETSYASPLSQ